MGAMTVPAQEDAPVGFLSALKRPPIRILAGSRAASRLAQATVSYGAMVFLATAGASQLQISVVAAASYCAALLFGFQGGTLSDSLSKRIAIVSGYIGLALICVLIPIFFGTDVSQLIVIMFLSSALMQIVTPSLKSAVALVATPAEMATVAATVGIAGSIASAVGSALLAPLLIQQTSIETLLYIAGGIYLVGAIRSFKLPAIEAQRSVAKALETLDWKPSALSLSNNARWIVEHGDVAAAILTGAIVVSLFEAFNTLIPVYVRDVLKANPANAVYIFAPAGLGFVLGTFLTPKLIGTIGARKLAVVAAVVLSLSMIAFGFIVPLAPLLGPISPLKWMGGFVGIEVNDRVAAASLIAIPANFGSTAAGAAVQAFVNTNVPLERQGATFGLQEVQENACTLALIMAVGVVSALVSSKVVMVMAPPIIVGMVVLLIRYSFKASAGTTLSGREAFEKLVGGSADDGAVDAGPS